MTPDEFKKQYLGSWTPDEAKIKLENRLADYYRETERFGNRMAAGCWKEFKRWCDDNGYTHKEVTQAKKAVLGWPEFNQN